MIYILAITFLILSHLIAYAGRNGCSYTSSFEKIIVFLVAILSFSAIFELGQSVISFFAHLEGALPEGIVSMIVYPVGFILFLLVIFLGLPKPIQKKLD